MKKIFLSLMLFVLSLSSLSFAGKITCSDSDLGVNQYIYGEVVSGKTYTD